MARDGENHLALFIFMAEKFDTSFALAIASRLIRTTRVEAELW
jgi:hypothetical protein